MFQSINPSVNRSKRYQTKTEQKQPGPVVAGCILWPQLTARTLSVGVTQSLHTAERHAQRDGTGSRFHRSEVVPHPGVSTEAAESSVLGPTLTGLTQRSRGN